MHIFCVRCGAVLANTAVMSVGTYHLLVCGATWWVLLCCNYFSSWNVVSHTFCAIRVFEVRALSQSPGLPLC